MQNIDVVITRHRPLVEWLLECNLIDPGTPIIEHAAISDVAGMHVLGVLPHWLSSKAASVTEVPMNGLTPADREAMAKGDLSLERVREVAGEPITYVVFGGKSHERSKAICKAAASPEHHAYNVDHHLVGCLAVHAQLLAGRQSWGNWWSDAFICEDPDEIDRERAARIAAVAQIPYDLFGPPTHGGDPEAKVIRWQTMCGHCCSEADLERGLFRVYASGPGWTPWIDPVTLEFDKAGEGTHG
jgi:hypothetical protein